MSGPIPKIKYFSIDYEKEIKGDTTRELNYIYCPFGLVALIIKKGENQTLYFVETDYQGSILGLLNPNGTYAEKYSYDAWGRRRNPDDWSYNNVTQPTLTDRGYTGHEHLDKFNLINMNGRMYDPYLGRFLSVDPIISAADNSQNYNGYGYCLNNPLKYSDPSGMSMKAYDESDMAFDSYLGWLCNRDMLTIGGGGGGHGGPGEGRNGTGLHGVYYDWYSGTYCSVFTEQAVGGPILNPSDFENGASPVFGKNGEIIGCTYYTPYSASEISGIMKQIAQGNANSIVRNSLFWHIPAPPKISGINNSLWGITFSNISLSPLKLQIIDFYDAATTNLAGLLYHSAWYFDVETGFDCTAVILAPMGFHTHVWRAEGNLPNYSIINVNPKNFFNEIQKKDVFAWPTTSDHIGHAVFYAGGVNLFEAFSGEGTVIRFTDFLNLYIKRYGYPTVYRRTSNN
jgi:RHS repeat-associated protein